MKTKQLTLKTNTQRICTVAMLIAVTVVLGTLSIRVGSGIKISLKFLPVVVCSTLFGPLWGGLCGALSDFISYLLNPAGGAYLFPITIVEFLYGVSFGLFFYKVEEFNKMTVLKIALCVLLNTVVLSVGAMAFILKDLMNMSYMQTLIYRLPSTALNAVIHFCGMILILKYILKFRKNLR